MGIGLKKGVGKLKSSINVLSTYSVWSLVEKNVNKLSIRMQTLFIQVITRNACLYIQDIPCSVDHTLLKTEW